ncbi:glutamine--fructose-6-phosphate transaminase (isomerizing) [Thiomicrospira sp. ALE5]|uniref:glutamine--fructose-6-phosphate transaminase (isomerizing) n=1 Tax=Thiomicrospira sp. ALE5 TaxID=748650 RepID=UPI0008E85C3E|nr:glutamine--fructose-6-phosphate transaminase (isomerizing) [Thiomicrospira sp. ALE5]SFR56823.1 glutamine--fructose-6-phosphate transaminase [Thiomicrospira sp. ALE5]
MCGIVGGVAERNLLPILLAGLKRLEYRGYDSSGLAVIDEVGDLVRFRAEGKIKALEQTIAAQCSSLYGQTGIAHTRWATHGRPAERNAHPHTSHELISVVHNGIIENYQPLKLNLMTQGIAFASETDSEVIAHSVYLAYQATKDLKEAVVTSVAQFHGAYALGIVAKDQPGRLIATRKGSPLVIGVGIGEHFIASDVTALLPVTQNFIFLEEGDLADIYRDQLTIYNQAGERVERPVVQSSLNPAAVELGNHRHFMHKEIFEQSQAVIDTLQGRITDKEVITEAFGFQAAELFDQIKQVQIVACGTSYHAGLVAKYWLEDIIRLPCQVEVASEYRYRNPVLQDHTLVVSLSQSGETADTLAALQLIKQRAQQLDFKHIASLCICNVAESSLTRESDMTFLTHAGPEIGVASTKAFTTQLVALALLMMVLGKRHKTLSVKRETAIVAGLKKLPGLIQNALTHEAAIQQLANSFADKHNALFLGRGTMYPIALEGALKLKEISYIHAEAYPAGELKHGPLALVDETIPVVAIAPHDDLLEKLKSNLQEVNARGGQMIVFEDEASNIQSDGSFKVLKTTSNVGRITAPITFNIPLQLLAYHVALIKGTDVDQPRNLAKSVTVE